jgi:hypothetical protein
MIDIKRKYTDTQTLGELTYENFTCKVLELKWLDNKVQKSCIQEGTYKYTKEVHPKYGKCLRLHDVPGRSGVLVHYGNYAGSDNPRTGHPDSLGCPMVGTSFIDLNKDGIVDIGNSKNTIEKLYDLVPDKGEIKFYS